MLGGRRESRQSEGRAADQCGIDPQAQCGLFLIILMENCWPFPLQRVQGLQGGTKCMSAGDTLSLQEKPSGDKSRLTCSPGVAGPASQ